MILHELYFDGLGAGGAPSGDLAQALARDFGSVERWRAEFSAMGKAEGGGSGWVLLSYSPHDKRLVNQWAADHTNAVAGGRPRGFRDPGRAEPAVIYARSGTCSRNSGMSGSPSMNVPLLFPLMEKRRTRWSNRSAT